MWLLLEEITSAWITTTWPKSQPTSPLLLICSNRRALVGPSIKKGCPQLASQASNSSLPMGRIDMFASTSGSLVHSCTHHSLTLYFSPLIIYNSVANVPDRADKIKNFTLFEQDLDNNALPQWMFITPNMSKFFVPLKFYIPAITDNCTQQTTLMTPTSLLLGPLYTDSFHLSLQTQTSTPKRHSSFSVGLLSILFLDLIIDSKNPPNFLFFFFSLRRNRSWQHTEPSSQHSPR